MADQQELEGDRIAAELAYENEQASYYNAGGFASGSGSAVQRPGRNSLAAGAGASQYYGESQGYESWRESASGLQWEEDGQPYSNNPNAYRGASQIGRRYDGNKGADVVTVGGAGGVDQPVLKIKANVAGARFADEDDVEYDEDDENFDYHVEDPDAYNNVRFASSVNRDNRASSATAKQFRKTPGPASLDQAMEKRRREALVTHNTRVLSIIVLLL